MRKFTRRRERLFKVLWSLPPLKYDFLNDYYKNMNAKYIYSGGCRIGDVGEPTELRDINEEPLFVGDIVLVQADNTPGHLSVVCNNKWTTYNNGNHVESETYENFVMGIRSVDFTNDLDCKWTVRRVKSYKDTVDGENWTDFKFSYKNT